MCENTFHTLFCERETRFGNVVKSSEKKFHYLPLTCSNVTFFFYYFAALFTSGSITRVPDEGDII